MRKISNEEVLNELNRVYKFLGNKLPSTKEWKHHANISLDVVIRVFGNLGNMFREAGFDVNKGTYKIKCKIIDDTKKAFVDLKNSGNGVKISDLLKKSGHNRATVMKYFGSVDNLLKISKVNINRTISEAQLIQDFINVYKELGKIPNAREIEKHCKFAKSTFLKKFGSIDNIIAAAGLVKPEPKLKIDDEELLDELRRVNSIVQDIPTTEDMRIHGRYSVNAYNRSFGSFSTALEKIGLSRKTQNKKTQQCPVCAITTVSMIKHLEKEHPDELKRQEQIILNLYRSGLSSRKICKEPGHVFVSATSISRVINKYITKEEKEELRKQKIKNTLKNDYASGKYNWINDINSSRNSSKEARLKNSENLKKAYSKGTRKVWNKGQSKDTNSSLKRQSENVSESMRSRFSTGEIEKKFGPETSNWNEDREKVAGRYRLGLNFTAAERREIKKRAGYKCEKCGISQEKLEEKEEVLHCDHVIAIKNGGLNDWKSNGQALCPKCHRSKTLVDIHENEKTAA